MCTYTHLQQSTRGTRLNRTLFRPDRANIHVDTDIDIDRHSHAHSTMRIEAVDMHIEYGADLIINKHVVAAAASLRQGVRVIICAPEAVGTDMQSW